MKEFSVLMSVYRNDEPADFRCAVESISIEQTVKPSEVIIIVDGPVPEELRSELLQIQQEFHFIKVKWLPRNVGLGKALQIGMGEVKNELVARMDSDDIALPDRFEKQLRCFEKNRDLSIVGGSITEFIDYPTDIIARRICPSENMAIKQYMKSRCAFNHVTVMFKKSHVMRAGNYQVWHNNEDYYLWIRMMKAGCRFRNLPDCLVNVRVGKGTYTRRGGWRYFKSEADLQRYMWNGGIIGFPRFCFNVAVRFGVQVLLPAGVRRILFQKLFRKSK